MTPDDTDRNKLGYSISNVVFLVALPAFTTIRNCYSFAGLPLHFRDSGWLLAHLGLAALAGNAVRSFICTPLQTFFGPWMAAPLSVANSCLSVPMAIWPNSEFAVIVGVIAFSMCNFGDAQQALISGAISNHETRQRASRISTLSFTLGYATAPFYGGLLYDLGGWEASAIFQLVICLIEMTCYWTSPWIHDNFLQWRQQHASLRKKPVQTECTNAVVPINSPMAESDSHASRKLDKEPFLPGDLRLPAFLIALAHGTNLCVYVVEWSVFALYFREVFGWNNALWAGIAQMSGDVLGAWALIALPKLMKGSSAFCSFRCLAPPYHISTCLLGWAVLHLLLASPDFVVAVAAQVLMGTLHVFQYQYVFDMITLYSNGNDRIFKNMLFVAAVCFNFGYAFAAVVALTIYDTVGKLAPFYFAAGIAGLAFILYTGCFFARVGLPRSLRDFEDQRAKANLSSLEIMQKREQSQVHEEQPAVVKREDTTHQMLNLPIPLIMRVNALFFDCGLVTQPDENLVSRGHRLASEFGLQFASVSSVVEKVELLMYGSLRSATTAVASTSSVH
eukprot:gnl/MRDRNA2_/MRDRNA2_74648_c0_seq1.p1 gnl/MRDRNA2_/MRDRNA2_74648_c0~~gnl/MRDRNA2_/MRDRNA2_74648_c0_seq1.p1  ORF type:complete len:562 (-),score=66.54 gnl/MRDRNA2_/MRDRNA2_74648_c0_seq1:283-1968(-)